MRAFVDKIGRGLGYVLAGLMVLLVALTLFQIFMRYALKQPDPSSEEVIRLLLIWLSVLAGAYCVYTRSHVGFSLFTDKMSAALASRTSALVRIIIAILTLALFIYGGTNLALIASELGQRSPVLGLPIALIYSVLPIAGVLILLFLAYPSRDKAANSNLLEPASKGEGL